MKALLMGLLATGTLLADIPGNTPVYYDGGKRGHIKSCRRLSDEKKAAGPTMTKDEMNAKGGLLCSRCPGSELNKEREAGGSKKTAKKKKKKSSGSDKDYGKYGRKGAKARKAWLEYPEKAYDPNTVVVCDALWMRVHEKDCPELLLGDVKKTMTLEQADKEGWRIGETGQSGRTRCCFQGYRRKYPEKDITDDDVGIVQLMKSGKYKYHLAGCHRFSVKPDQQVMTRREATKLPGYYMCTH